MYRFFLRLGRESDFVIFSTVRSMPKSQIERNPTESWMARNLGFIADSHQINVALTRAKKGLIIIGKNTFFLHIKRIDSCQCFRKWLAL